MSEVTIQSLIVGVVAIVSALVGGTLPIMIQRKNELAKLKREKMEELYKNVTYWYDMQFGVVIQFRLVVEGQSNWGMYFDALHKPKAQGDITQAEIIIGVYFN